MPATASTRQKLLLSVAASLLFLLGAELLTRLVGRYGPGESAFNPFRELLVDLAGFQDTDRLMVSDPELFWRLRPSVNGLPWTPGLWLDNRTNAHGMRDPERRLARSDPALRVFCLGDSCTYGSGVRLADSYPQQMEALLAEAFFDRSVEVWNGGVPGWTSDQGMVFLERWGERVRPEIVCVNFGLNDARHWDLGHHAERGHGRCTSDRSRRQSLASWPARLDQGLQRSAFYRLLDRLISAEEAGGSEESDASDGSAGSQRVPATEFRDNLRAMTTESRRLGAAPVFILWPIRWQLEPKEEGGELAPLTIYQKTLQATARELSVPLLDLVEKLRGTAGLYVDSVHMNAAGNRLVARELARFLDLGGMLPDQPKR